MALLRKTFSLSLLVAFENFVSISAFTTKTSKIDRCTRRSVLTTTNMASAKESVAIIGGGIAGLSCAQVLEKSRKFQPTVFDTGRLRPGGRCASRYPDDDDTSTSSSHHADNDYSLLRTCIVDHAAQILTVPPSDSYTEFQKQVQAWADAGVLKEFEEGAVYEIASDSRQEPFQLKPIRSNDHTGTMYYATNGMGSIPLHMMETISSVEQDVWVSPSSGVKYNQSKQQWIVKAKGQTLGSFDRLVIAHNGKCADRLMSKTPAKDMHSLLRVNFSATVPKEGGKRMTLNSIYSLSFALKKVDSPLSVALPEASGFVCGFIENEPNLRFLSCQTRKYKGTRDDIEIWTVLSSAKFAKEYKALQENIPDETVEAVTGLMLKSLEKSLGLARGSMRGRLSEPVIILSGAILESRLQLWGAAVPLNTWRLREHHGDGSEQHHDGFLYDAEYCVGACGDWLMDPSIAGAWESGRRLANYMVTDGSESVGLPSDGDFHFCASNAVAKAGIGSLRSLC